MRRLLSKAVGRGGGEDTKAKSNAAADNDAAALSLAGGGKLHSTATKHRQRRARGGLGGCITAQPESSPSPEMKPEKPAVFLDATSQFVGLGFDPFR